MTTSQTSSLSEPHGDDRVDNATLAYFRARNRARMYDAVLDQFEKSEITQATLARRMGKRPEVINRLLSAPGNWETDTVSDMLFAISGGEFDYTVGYPLSAGKRNYASPDWVLSTGEMKISVSVSRSDRPIVVSASYSK
jgi:hypothetical protein